MCLDVRDMREEMVGDFVCVVGSRSDDGWENDTKVIPEESIVMRNKMGIGYQSVGTFPILLLSF